MSPQVERLSDHELQVIQLRYGVGQSSGNGTQPDEADLEGFSPEQIDELEVQALRKLRHMTLDSFNVLREAV